MTDQIDIEISIVALALMASGKMSARSIRDLLINSRKNSNEISINYILDGAGVHKDIVSGSMAAAESLILRGIKMGIYPVHIGSFFYPATLRTIIDAPPILYYRGNVDVLNFPPGVAVVGTRKASSHGLKIAYRISEYISRNNMSVVSGLALGIDAAAHEGALNGSGKTIAVLAHGLDKASPRANSHLADRILDEGGIWVSEQPPFASARPEYFVFRNRIQVGLSSASVIVEGEEKSGSATQAEYCIKNNRILFAVLPDDRVRVVTNGDLPSMLVKHRSAIPIKSKFDYDLLIDSAKNKSVELIKIAREM